MLLNVYCKDSSVSGELLMLTNSEFMSNWDERRNSGKNKDSV